MRRMLARRRVERLLSLPAAAGERFRSSMFDVTHPASAPIMKPVFCLPLSGMARCSAFHRVRHSLLRGSVFDVSAICLLISNRCLLSSELCPLFSGFSHNSTTPQLPLQLSAFQKDSTLRLSWKRKCQNRAAASLAARGNPSFVVFHDSFANRESKPGAVRLAVGKEGIEEVRQDIR